MKSFTDLGLSSELAEACERKLVWYFPLKIQTEVIPLALQGIYLILKVLEFYFIE